MTQVYPLQMTDIPEKPFDKIAIDLVSYLNIFALGNQHTRSIIDHLTGWPEAFPHPQQESRQLLFMHFHQ